MANTSVTTEPEEMEAQIQVVAPRASGPGIGVGTLFILGIVAGWLLLFMAFHNITDLLLGR